MDYSELESVALSSAEDVTAARTVQKSSELNQQRTVTTRRTL